MYEFLWKFLKCIHSLGLLNVFEKSLPDFGKLKFFSQFLNKIKQKLQTKSVQKYPFITIDNKQ